MKNKVLFVSLLFLLPSLLSYSAVINISSATPDALRTALNGAATGDVIEMAAGTYVESNSNYIAFAGKNVTVRAAEGAEVIIQPQVSITLAEGAVARFENVKFDVSRLMELATWYEHLIYPSDANEDNKLELEGCEFYGFNINKSMIYCSTSNRLASVTINNCYFHNIMKSILFVENTTAMNVQIKNSTFANISTDAESYWAGPIDVRAESSSYLVDHCTFYNVLPMNTDYSATGKITITDGVVSNCIFMLPESTDGVRAIRGVAQANNCLVYNYLKDSGWGIHSSVTKSNCINGQDPLFVDAANGDFHLANNWLTGNVSPACGAGSDGSDLGDPRWHTEAVYPETDFESSYAFTASKAILAGNIAYETNESAPIHPYIRYIHTSETTGTATWKIKVNRACYVSATINMAGNTWTEDPSDSKMYEDGNHIFIVEVHDQDNNLIESVREGPDNDNGYATYPTVNIPGTIHFAEPGVYTIKLLNPRNETRCGVANVTLSYAGGDVVALSESTTNTLNVVDALISSGCTRADGQISAASWPSADVKWNVSTAASSFYDVTLNINTTNAHQFKIELFEDEAAEPIATVAEAGYNAATGNPLALSLGRIYLSGGKNYVVKVTNQTSGSAAKVVDVTLDPVPTPVTSIPAALAADNAVLSALAYVDEEDEIHFTPEDKLGYVLEQFAVWKVNVSEAYAGTFLFTMNMTSENGHAQSYRITVLDEEEQVVDVYDKNPDGSGDKTITHYLHLAAGTYSVRVQSTHSWSNGHIVSINVTQPELLQLEETAENNDILAAHFDEAAADIQVNRTLVSGMYNTICLPFDLNSTQIREALGEVVLMSLESTELDGGILTLNFANESSIYRGIPYIIKPARQIVNPVFKDAVIKVTEPTDVTQGNVTFVGTLIQGTISASPNNLFVGSGDKLYFPTGDMTIKGFRAWFRIAESVPAGVIQRARIAEGGNIVTELELIDGAWLKTENMTSNATLKIINKGQIYIIRDGVNYNVVGQKIKD
ncbi:MAG: DUF4957 domain-containing protein [Paludibacteraceae bacterium]|nr:DUF4957 domain-containing protein [Paludibacteraceae bacterium]